MRTELDPDSLVQWAALALEGMRKHRRAIDALNVFPVPDGDTGTNMFLTLEAGVEALASIEGAATQPGGAHLAALARGMLLGARGNSGVILSELVRGLSSTPAQDGVLDGAWLAAGLRRAADAARGAVAQPKEGTVLTVARLAGDAAMAAADGAVGEDGRLMAVAQAAASAARTALAKTTDQLEALRRAGVVDAGGRGYVVFTDALLEVVSGQRTELPEFTRKEPLADEGAEGADESGYAGPSYEVMYLLEAADEDVPGLKEKLSGMGDSLVVVGGDRLWSLHVHVDDAGAAIEAAMAVGRPYRIRVTYLSSVVDRVGPPESRGVVVIAHGPGVVDLLESSGVQAVRVPELGRPSMAEILAGIEATSAHDVVVLTSDKDSHPVAEAAAVAARDSGRRVSVIPTRSIVQSLAGVAVHDAEVDFNDDVIGMTRAAWATQYAGLTTAVRDAMTTAGLCRIGDELGVIGGDILEIGPDVMTVAKAVLNRMLGRGGAELVTVIVGATAPAGMADDLEEWLRHSHPGIEYVAYDGGQPRWHAIIGVE